MRLQHLRQQQSLEDLRERRIASYQKTVDEKSKLAEDQLKEIGDLQKELENKQEELQKGARREKDAGGASADAESNLRPKGMSQDDCEICNSRTSRKQCSGCQMLICAKCQEEGAHCERDSDRKGAGWGNFRYRWEQSHAQRAV